MNVQKGTPRERILGAAKSEFAANGFRGGSLNAVAKRSGYTRAGLLHHFPSKDSMLLALLEDRDRELTERFSPISADAGIFELLEITANVVPAILADRELVLIGHVLTIEAAGAQHPAHAWVANRYDFLLDLYSRAVRNSIAVGEIDPEADPLAIASMILAVVEGTESQWLIEERIRPEKVLALLKSVFNSWKHIPTNM